MQAGFNIIKSIARVYHYHNEEKILRLSQHIQEEHLIKYNTIQNQTLNRVEMKEELLRNSLTC